MVIIYLLTSISLILCCRLILVFIPQKSHKPLPVHIKQEIRYDTNVLHVQNKCQIPENYMLWQNVGVFLGGINGEEENTKFDINKNIKKAKIFNTETPTASLCVHYLKHLLFYKTDR